MAATGTVSSIASSPTFTPQEGTVPVPLISKGDIVRCPHCSMKQFAIASLTCRRCHQPLIVKEPEPAAIPSAAPVPPHDAFPNQQIPIEYCVAIVARGVRHRLGLSMLDVAQRMRAPRTFVSKIENAKILPTIRTIERLAKVLGMETAKMIRMCEYLSTGQ